MEGYEIKRDRIYHETSAKKAKDRIESCGRMVSCCCYGCESDNDESEFKRQKTKKRGVGDRIVFNDIHGQPNRVLPGTSSCVCLSVLLVRFGVVK